MNQDSIFPLRVSVPLFPSVPCPHKMPLVIPVSGRFETRALEAVEYFKVNERVQKDIEDSCLLIWLSNYRVAMISHM